MDLSIHINKYMVFKSAQTTSVNSSYCRLSLLIKHEESILHWRRKGCLLLLWSTREKGMVFGRYASEKGYYFTAATTLQTNNYWLIYSTSHVMQAETIKFTLEQQMVFLARMVGHFDVADEITPIRIDNFDWGVRSWCWSPLLRLIQTCTAHFLYEEFYAALMIIPCSWSLL